mmetsp:Transcript_2904/g.5193  ORF Transcript_2904/g.5193 Transcript_2904/m.5193 type:complete len:349 (+) Transcript_2904:58-1104(+)
MATAVQVLPQGMAQNFPWQATVPKAGLELQTFRYVPCNWAEEAVPDPMSPYKPFLLHQDVNGNHLLTPTSLGLHQSAAELPVPYQSASYQPTLVPSPQSMPGPSMVMLMPQAQQEAVCSADVALEARQKAHEAAVRTAQAQAAALSQPPSSEPHAPKAPCSVEPAVEPDVEVPASHSKGKPGSKKKTKNNGGAGPGRHICVDEWPETDTTVMLRNISSRYTAEELLVELMDRGFQDTFDMLYLPMDFKSHRNMGYCFLNFVRPENARRCKDVFNGVQLPRYKSSKVLEVSRAFVQGLKANLQAYQKKDSQRVRNPWFRPMIFDVDGSEAELIGTDIDALLQAFDANAH